MSYISYKEAISVWARAQHEYDKLSHLMEAATTIRNQAWADLEREAATLDTKAKKRIIAEQFPKDQRSGHDERDDVG